MNNLSVASDSTNPYQVSVGTGRCGLAVFAGRLRGTCHCSVHPGRRRLAAPAVRRRLPPRCRFDLHRVSDIFLPGLIPRPVLSRIAQAWFAVPCGPLRLLGDRLVWDVQQRAAGYSPVFADDLRIPPACRVLRPGACPLAVTNPPVRGTRHDTAQGRLLPHGPFITAVPPKSPRPPGSGSDPRMPLSAGGILQGCRGSISCLRRTTFGF